MMTATLPLPLMRSVWFAVGCCLASGGGAWAATLTFEAPLQIRPDPTAPAIGALPPGASITALLREEFAAAGVDNLPVGWVSLRHGGPFYGYVPHSAVGEDFVVAPGVAIHAAPDAASPVVHTIAGEGRADALERAGDWSKVVFKADLVVFVHALPPSSRRTAEIEPPAAAVTPASNAAEPTVAPAASRERGREERAEPVPLPNNGTPRVFEGFLTRTRRILGRGPKLDHQLVDAENRRIVLLDLSALMLTSPLDTFEGKFVTVYGAGISRPDVKDPIIRVERLRLAR